MEWWQILLAVVFTVPLLFLFIMGVVIGPIIDNYEHKKKVKQWNEAHPNLMRIRCKDCKYCKCETYYQGRYPNGYPQRRPTYCSYLRRNIDQNSSCMIAEPTAEFYRSKDKIDIRPSNNTKVYFSAYGNCYHSSLNCPSMRGSQHRYGSVIGVLDRRPCPKCWEERDGVLYPKI